ncbi:restriction endonuclease subunit S [Acinetobacter sp. A2]|uniref:restriction endonuclease subunit S n=1 Tax=Acinetobacter sp. A2 TaxID=362457 RepID=UPI001446A836|nr:restriction endonuclease subunit S [Acinetobacter sp. A2]
MESNTILYKPLGDVIELLTDYHANGAYEKLKENVTLLDKENHAVMIRTTNFEANDFTNNLIYIDEHAYEFLKKSKVYASDLIMNKIANPGTVYFMPEISKPVSLGMNLFLIRINPKKANPYFIYAYLRKNEHYVKSFASGSTTKTITKDDVRRLKIYTPPLAEQNKIAKVLSTWDQAISATEKMLENSQQQKKALMQQLLTGKKRLLDENGVKFSGEWKDSHLVDIAKISKGKALSSKDLEIGSYPVIAGGKTSPYTHSEYTHENVITVSASGAYAGYVAFYPYKIWASDCSVVSNKIGSDINFIYHLLVSMQTIIYSLQSGGAQPHIYPKDIEGLKILIPPLVEQKKIASVLSLADQEIDTLQKKLDCLKQEKKALMQQLLTGKKRVKVAA